MSNVSLIIGGRNYTVACAAGEEDHITGLGQAVDAKIQSMGAAGTNENRQLLFAALLLADEVHEAKTPSRAAPTPPILDDSHAERLEAIATKLEACALALEG